MHAQSDPTILPGIRMTIWFTSDHHFGHERIIELAKRPFASVEGMDEHMIACWNDRVKPGDTVYHVGDFAFTDHDPYLRRLNGQKFLVPGNHDHSNRVKKATGWVKAEKIMDVTLPDGTMVVLCHYAMRVWSRSHYGAIHLYGHRPLARMQDQAEDTAVFYKRFGKKMNQSRNVALIFAWLSAFFFCLGAILVLRVVAS
jgi:calcineurin-like phosphoesterase family protein